MTEKISTKTGLDTNVLVYAFDIHEKAKHEKAVSLLKRCWQGEEEFVITSQSLAELYEVLTKKITKKYPVPAAKELISLFVQSPYWHIVSYNEATVVNAISEKHRHFWDRLILTTLKEQGVTIIYTENTKDFNTIKTINPFT